MAEASPKLKSKWKKKMRQPLPKWHTYQGNTNDCGPFCATIVANTLGDAPLVDAPMLARAMEKPAPGLGRLLPSRIKGWATFPWGVARVLRSLGFRARWRPLASIKRLEDNLDKEIISIVIVGNPLHFANRKWHGWSHYKVLYASSSEQGWAFVDPAATTSEVFSYQDAKSFKREWTQMGRNLIEVWKDEV